MIYQHLRIKKEIFRYFVPFGTLEAYRAFLTCVSDDYVFEKIRVRHCSQVKSVPVPFNNHL